MKKVLTVSTEQAKKIGLLTAHTKSKYPVLYESTSGVNLKKTGLGEVLEIPRQDSLTRLEALEAKGYCTIGTIYTATVIAAPTLSSLNVGDSVPEDHQVTIQDMDGEDLLGEELAGVIYEAVDTTQAATDVEVGYTLVLPDGWVVEDEALLTGTVTIDIVQA
jgi:hypothetical protein